MSEFHQQEVQDDYSFEIPEHEVDGFIWAREQQEVLLGRALTPQEEKELWQTGEVTQENN